MTADATDPAPGRGRGPLCSPTLNFGHYYRRADDGTRVWVCRSCGRRVPFNTDGEATT